VHSSLMRGKWALAQILSVGLSGEGLFGVNLLSRTVDGGSGFTSCFGNGSVPEVAEAW